MSAISQGDLRAADALTSAQSAAVLHLTKKAQVASEAAKPKLRKRLKRMGHGPQVFDDLLLHIRDKAQVVVHFNPSQSARNDRTVIDAFLDDTHYRNQFETGIGGAGVGGGRENWESALFAKHYDSPDVLPGHRPKYGSLNLLNHTHGSAPSYGTCFFTLRNIRLRVTFTFGDSAYDREPLATVEHFAHILQRMPKADLKALVSIARDPQLTTPGASPAFREAQIHGDIEFARDIAHVTIDAQSPGAAQVRQWAAQNGIPTSDVTWSL